MQRTGLFFLFFFLLKTSWCQLPTRDVVGFSISVFNEKQQALESASVELRKASNHRLIKTALTDTGGKAWFYQLLPGDYYIVASFTGYQSQTSASYSLPLAANKPAVIILQPAGTALANVNVTGRKPFIQHAQGKVLVNVDASVTNTGTTVLEVLEKSPGVTVDKNGTISLQSKTGVLVLIDDKPTYLSGTDLNNLLSSMSSSQVEQIELMTNPPAKYDASGNAGIINIKTKKNKQKGLNGSVSIAAGQGRYPKSNNSLVLNFRNGRFNTFLTYSLNANKYYTDIYALRKYYDANHSVTAVLDQPTWLTGTSYNNTLKAGVDFYVSDKTTFGIMLTGTAASRKGRSDANATWLNATGNVDSAIGTTSTSNTVFKNGAVNINLRHSVSKAQDIGVDIDWLHYDITNAQAFSNQLLSAGGYNDASKGNIPSQIQILSGKADQTLQLGRNSKLESGWKSSYISTDNLAAYQFYDGAQWTEDDGKSNHFLYKENIHALYSSLEQKWKSITLQAGLRYEYTSYKAHQLGNAVRKDSAFSRNYNGLFPSGYVSWQADSSNAFTFTAGRRIDRPAFQKLNPFVFIINKYTYQTGNPYYLPQYSWNMELSHQFKNFLTTTASYSITKNYFSQLFLTDANGILYYSEGNVGHATNFGLSITVQANPFTWWSLTGQALMNHKELKGYVWNNFQSSITQLNISMNNQFHISNAYTAELSGFYTSRARNDLQEVLDPTGQLSAGISRPVLKKKAVLKLSARDIFYTQAMEGNTSFQSATEYFILHRDTRVVSISFSYRFGKPLKSTKRNNGSAADEIQRVGNGN